VQREGKRRAAHNGCSGELGEAGEGAEGAQFGAGAAAAGGEEDGEDVASTSSRLELRLQLDEDDHGELQGHAGLSLLGQWPRRGSTVIR